MKRIDRVFAFVMIDQDGNEGVPAVSMPSGLVMPLMGADLERVESLRPLAEMFASKTGSTITLCVFGDRREVEIIRPESRCYPADQTRPLGTPGKPS